MVTPATRATRRYWNIAVCLSRKIEARNATVNDRRNILKRLFSLHNSKQSATLQLYATGHRAKDCSTARELQPHDPEVGGEEVESYCEQDGGDRKACVADRVEELDRVSGFSFSLFRILDVSQGYHPAYRVEDRADVHGSES